MKQLVNVVIFKTSCWMLLRQEYDVCQKLPTVFFFSQTPRKPTILLWTLWVCTYSVSYVVVVLIMINNRMHNLQGTLRVILHLVSILFFPNLFVLFFLNIKDHLWQIYDWPKDDLCIWVLLTLLINFVKCLA